MAETQVDAQTAQWLVSGFTLVNAIVIAISAFLMDRFTTKQLFTGIFILFVGGSLLAGWGADFPMLLAGRVLQAMCAGVLLPMSMTVLLLVFPHGKRGAALGTYNLVIMFAPAIGPVLAGLLTDSVGWHVIFLGMGVLGAGIIVLAGFVMKDFGEVKPVLLDKTSVTLSSLGLLSLLYGFSIFSTSLWLAVLLVVFGAALLTVFSRRQFSLEQPFLQLRVLQNRQYLRGVIIQMLIQASLAAGIVLPLYVQGIRGMSAAISGLVMMPGAVLGALAGYFSGRLSDKFGPRWLAISGVSLVVLGSVGTVFFSLETSVTFMLVCYSVLTVGLMLANTPLNLWAISGLPDDILNHGNAVSSALRQTAATLSTAVVVSLMALVASTSPSPDSASARLSGITAAYGFGVAIAAVGLVLVVAYVGDRKPVSTRSVIEIDAAMKLDPFTVSADELVADVVEKFIEHRTSGFPIIDGEAHVVGFISDGDVMRYLAKSNVRFDVTSYTAELPDNLSFAEKAKRLLEAKALSIASRNVICVDRMASLPEVCQIFYQRKLNKLPVLQNGVLVGTVSRGDVMRTMLGKLPLGEG
jgi:EmrB/QacA subfamily drug resistance transporter